MNFQLLKKAKLKVSAKKLRVQYFNKTDLILCLFAPWFSTASTHILIRQKLAKKVNKNETHSVTYCWKEWKTSIERKRRVKKLAKILEKFKKQCFKKNLKEGSEKVQKVFEITEELSRKVCTTKFVLKQKTILVKFYKWRLKEMFVFLRNVDQI